MGLLGRLFSRPSQAAKPSADQRLVQARFDAAQFTTENSRHWLGADAFSADSAHSPTVRKTLRERSRYEVANNSYASGIVRSIAEDTVGSGPRLQLLLPNANASEEPTVAEALGRIEKAWHDWCDRIDLGGKLRVMRATRIRDGECFALMISNPAVKATNGVSLDIQLVETEQVASPAILVAYNADEQDIDGVILDRIGNPIAYLVLQEHPGSELFRAINSAVRHNSGNVIHYYRPDRPGQHRGIPELTPALALFSQLRRYTSAVLSSAEAAATFAGILYTDSPPGGEAKPVKVLEPIDLHQQTLLTMPAGWKMEQLKAEQPTSSYSDFKGEVLNEIARCLSVPFNVAAGNSGGYNYASGRLDFQIYHRAITVERSVIERVVLNKIFAAWFREAVLLSNVVPPRMRTAKFNHRWMWSAAPHVDPQKEAQAAQVRLQSGLTTLSDEYAAQGKDWQEQMRQRASERKYAMALGLVSSADDDQEADIEEDDDESAAED